MFFYGIGSWSWPIIYLPLSPSLAGEGLWSKLDRLGKLRLQTSKEATPVLSISVTPETGAWSLPHKTHGESNWTGSMYILKHRFLKYSITFALYLSSRYDLTGTKKDSGRKACQCHEPDAFCSFKHGTCHHGAGKGAEAYEDLAALHWFTAWSQTHALYIKAQPPPFFV